MKATKELAFEDAIEEWLLTKGGYDAGVRPNYDPAFALDTAELFTFIGATQADAWEDLVKRHGGDRDLAQRRFVERLAKQIDERGTIDVLRHGVEDMGIDIRLAYFRPASGLNPDLERRYQANRLTVTRQLQYAPDVANELDLTLFVNGLPVATAELKNKLSGQSVEHAMAQYRADRDPRDPMLSRRAVVHFAVDPDDVMMTTRLAGKGTRFLPFNRGSDPGNTGCGKGNPSNPDGYRTAHLWEVVWQRDAWLDILHRFLHVEPRQPGGKGKAAFRDGAMIFPRYHQWDAVRHLERKAREDGSGQNYLIQHSAGSGKSNTIAWLAHRLASLHDDSDRKVFDKIVVITDRRILDQQLQATIYQFEHAHGVVARIDESSTQLAEALRSAEAKVVVTTLQKFPFIVEEIAGLPKSTYAVIIDEAHSSQTGETAQEMKRALAGIKAEVTESEDGEVDAADAIDAYVEAAAKARGRHDNLSMFAFTATPKGKTLELFGEADADGNYRATHLYSMRQAIEENFILDVLGQYTTYESYFRLAKAGAEDPEVAVREASRWMAKYVSLHPTHVAQKAEVIVEHFRGRTRPRIGGRAKAMVVCRSRLAAVRFRIAIDAYLSERGYGDTKALVAFSGTVTDPELGEEFTEPRMNGFPESQTAERFGTDEYQILVVAEKFQTGFDQPLLHTMFVDKKLAGVNAVQTLSRLNRIHPEKEDTFVLDFANTADDIQRSFAPYYDVPFAIPTSPNELYDAWNEVDRFGVVLPAEVEGFAAAYFAPDPADREVQARLYALLDPAGERFADLGEDDQEECRTALKRFTARYSFISQIVPYADTDMEKRHAYCRFLLRRLPRREPGTLDLGDEVSLSHLRVAKTGEHDLRLPEGGGAVRTFGGDGPGGYSEALEPLSAIIQRINDAFGVNLTEADRLHLEGIATDMAADPGTQRRAAVNSQDNFGLEFDKDFLKAVVARMQHAQDLTFKILDDDTFKTHLTEAFLPRVYEQARIAYQKHCPIGELLGRDEDQHLEFKSTLLWDLERGERSRLIEGATLKTIAAFLNSRFGGTLVIGAADDRSLLGLEHDYERLRKPERADSDVFQLHLMNLVEASMRLAAAANVTSEVLTIDGRDLCRVHVEPSGHPVYADVAVRDKQGQESRKRSFFVRLNNGTRAIEDEVEIERYVAQRWGAWQQPEA